MHCCRQARCPLELGLLPPGSRRFIAQGSHLKVAAGPFQLLVSLGCTPIVIETAKRKSLVVRAKLRVMERGGREAVQVCPAFASDLSAPALLTPTRRAWAAQPSSF